jgi:xanthine dehydrogenase YagS FAD-binding subunit
MQSFEYANPLTKADAASLLAEKPGEAVVLAGGTDLLSLMKDYVATPERVVNIKSVQDLGGISYDASTGLRIGATAKLVELMGHDKVKQEYPSLVQAVEGIGSPQIWSMATVGGNLCQRPRCWYYRAGFGLLALKDAKPMVPTGDNRYHAILGNSGPAYFVNPSSLAPAFIALGTKLKIMGSRGEREVDLEQFYQIPKSGRDKEYALASDEFITDILVPPAADKKNAVYEVREKGGLGWPLATAAVAFAMDGNKIRSPRVVLGHVAPIPWVSADAEKRLDGRSTDERNADRAGKDAVKGAKALSKNKYKIQLAQVAVERAVLRASGKEV